MATDIFFRHAYQPVRQARLWLSMAMLWLAGAAVAQQDIRFEHYTSDEGLPTNELYVVTESSNGYLWIGNKAGLTRFDGLNFQSLLHERNDDLALPGRSVQYLLEDSRGRLWVSLEAAGVVEVDNDLNILRHLSTTSSPLQLPNDTIWGMAEDCHGNIWLGFTGDGIARYNPEADTLEPVPVSIADDPQGSRVVATLHVDDNCRVWAGMVNKGLYYLDESSGEFVPPVNPEWDVSGRTVLAISSHMDNVYANRGSEIGIFNSTTAQYLNKINLAELSGLARVSIRSMSVNNGILWVATNAGLYSIQLTIRPRPDDTADLDQLLAEGTFSANYYIKHYRRQETIAGTLASDALLSVATGNNGNVWVATQDNGLIYKPPGWDSFSLLRRNPLIENHLPSNNINSTYSDATHLWLGTYDAGLARFDYRQHNVDTPTGVMDLPFQLVWDMHIDRNGTVWIAGVNQIVQYRSGQEDVTEIILPETITDALSGIRPMAFIELEDALWVIAKHRYLLRYDTAATRWVLRETGFPGHSTIFTDYLKLNDHQFLVSSESALLRYDAVSDEFTVLLDTGEDHIQQIALDQDNHLWLAQKSGFARYRMQDAQLTRILLLRYSAAMSNTVINNLAFDAQNKPWFGTLNGLFKLMPTIEKLGNNSEPEFLHLTSSDGLPSSEMSEDTLLLLDDGRMAIGTNQGQVMFDPREIRAKTGRPRIDINSLNTLEHEYSGQSLSNEPLSFDYDDNTVTLRFNAVTFNNRDDLNYQYRLNGWDDNWITTRQVPQINYSRLSHGNYTFNARARIGNTDWGPVNDAVSFTIRRPPWLTWWAYTLYGLMALLLLLSLQQRQKRARERRRVLFQARERQEFAETQTHIATEFARAIHYEEIANTLSATLKESLNMVRMLVHFPNEQNPTHEYVYHSEWARQIPAKVDFESLYADFNSNPKMRHHQQPITASEDQEAIQLSLPLGAKRPVQAVVCIQFEPGEPPRENDIALASLVAQTAETAVNNTLLLERVSQLAELNQRANDAKSEFISTVSHEIRTPLHGLMGMLDLLNNSDTEQQREVILERLTESSQQLLSVVDDVLDISKIEANKVELNQDTFELRELIEHVVQLFNDQASAKKLYLHGVIAPGTCGWWLGDKTRLVQILTNLTNNAIKFTHQGGLFISAREVRGERPGLLLSVADTGLGMSPDVLERLFDQYQQAENWTWKKYGGSGLGLSITKRLVDLMEGHIEVSSQVDQGSRFDIFLPLEKPGILDAIEPLVWPEDFTIHLACGYASEWLQPLLSQGNRVIVHDDATDAIRNLSGGHQVLITTRAELADNSPIPAALLTNLDISSESDGSTPDASGHISFCLDKDWPRLQVWIMAAAGRSESR